MTSLLELLQAGGNESSLREQERQLPMNADHKVKVLWAAVCGGYDEPDAKVLLERIYADLAQDNPHARLSQAWVAIQKAKGVTGSAASRHFNNEIWKQNMRDHPAVVSFRANRVLFATFFQDAVHHWLLDAVNGIEAVAAAPATRRAPIMASGPLVGTKIGRCIRGARWGHFYIGTLPRYLQ